jgi:16S rRNA processing protein RimM
LAVGRVIKPHGVHGEVRVEPLTDDPARFKRLTHVYVGERQPRRVAVESVRFHQGWVLLRLGGHATRTEAELLRGELLQVTAAEAAPLEEGEYYLFQLEGLDVYTEAGDHLGRLTGVLETGANNVFVVQGARGELLLPDIPDVIQEIDIEGGRLVIRPLPGLLGDFDE